MTDRREVHTRQRTIFHVDVDCFYVSAEILRNPDLKGKPVAVTQFNSGGFVAVSYEAKAAGIKKGDERGGKFDGARLLLVFILTLRLVFGCPRIGGDLGIGEGGRQNIPFFKARPECAMDAVMKRCPELLILPMDTRHYRNVSTSLLRLLQEWGGPDVIVEKASIDDFFLDMTSRMAQSKANADAISVEPGSSSSPSSSTVIKLASLTPASGTVGLTCVTASSLTSESQEDSDGDEDDGYWEEGRAKERRGEEGGLSDWWVRAWMLATDLRTFVAERMPGLTLSLGIAENKLQAKLISHLDKPDGQTLLLPRDAYAVLGAIPMRKVPNL
ncbi:hypothetical protein HK102_012707, partial [Quaeritorhiza haematococci]